MPGFNLSIGNIHFPDKKENHKINASIFRGDTYKANRFTLKKFEADKLSIDRDTYLLVLEGVVLNKKSLVQGHKDWEEAVIDLYRTKGDSFFKELRGSFSGLLFDKKEAKWIIFTDHIGSKPIYYSVLEGNLFFSSEIADLYGLFKANHFSYDLDEEAAYMLLSYGYMLGDSTLSSKIKKLEAGKFIKVINGQDISVSGYYRLPQSMESGDCNEDEIIEELDIKFRKAVGLQFEKDKEYGYQHLVGLSGGLDSRMTSWVAHEMGYSKQVNFTFSQSNYLDETIAKEIAADLKHEWIFKALDNGLFLEDIDKINAVSGGNILYYGLAHSNSLYKLLNFENLGIIHTGQLGDIVIGSFIKSFSVKSLNQLGGAYSKKFVSKIKSSTGAFNNFSALELALIYQRGFNGANTGLLASQGYSETLSPFYDKDFFEFCLSIPIQARMGHNLYLKWVLKKYPRAAAYVWETSKRKLNHKALFIKLRGRSVPLCDFFPLVLQRLGMKRPSIPTKFHMNPLEYWYQTNEEIQQFQNLYYKENISRLDACSDLKNDCVSLFTKGSAVEKNQVLSLLSALKLHF